MTLNRMTEKTLSLGDRIKSYEASQYTFEKDNYVLDKTLPYIARIDGHTFSTFTRGFKKPWDPLLSGAMINTMNDLVNEFRAVTGYTQSDEISLIFVPIVDSKTGEYRNLPFNGRVIKLTSLMAGYASARFNYHLQQEYEQKDLEDYKPSAQAMDKITNGMAHFDARVFNLPKEEVFN